MRHSWNFSTAIFEIWVLVLTKPGWANETPTTSLRVPGDYNNNSYRHHHHHYHPVEHQQHDDPNHAFSVATSGNIDWSSSNAHHHQQQLFQYHHNLQHHPRSSLFSSSGSNNHHYYSRNHNNNNNHHQRHLDSSASALALASSSLYNPPHRCYVCLPPNKNSREAQQILDIFAKELRPLIPDCSAFDPYVDAGRFEFDCPARYGGCILRIHGSNISRACSKYRVNDCKKANSVEFCYCTTALCNDKKPEPAVIPAVVTHMSRNAGADPRRRGGESRSSLHQGRTGEMEAGGPQGIRTRVSEDDEDVLNPHASDDEDSEGSGTGSADQQNHVHHHLNTFIDPSFTSTMDPTLLHEETVAVEDPNPHTKIGISMTASTSSGASSSILSSRHNRGHPTILASALCNWWSPSLSSFYSCHNNHCEGSLSRVGSGSCTHAWAGAADSLAIKNILHLFLHLQRAIFVRLFGEQVVEEKVVHHLHHPMHHIEQKSDGSISITGIVLSDDGSLPSTKTTTTTSSHHQQEMGGGERTRTVVAEKKEAAPAATKASLPPPPLLILPFCFNSQLCFIISLVLTLQLLLS